MSLYTDDNYFGMDHEVLDTKSFNYIKDGVEHEIVMCLRILYRDNDSLLSVDTKYWTHYSYTTSTGMCKDFEGKTSDEMDDVTLELFETYVNEIEENERSK